MASNPQLRDPELRRIRALRMIEMRIKGKSLKEIAAEFNLGTEQVKRTLSWAKKAEIVVEAEDRILREILPAAEEAVKAVLSGINDEVKAKTALEIFKATLPSFGKPKTGTGAPVATTDTDLASYINSIRQSAGQLDDVVDGQLAAGPGGAALEAQLALPPTAEEPAPQGLSIPSERNESPVDAEGEEVDSE